MKSVALTSARVAACLMILLFMVAPSCFASMPASVRTVAACGRPAGRPCALPAVGPVPVAERIAVVGPALLGGRGGGIAARVAPSGLRGGRLRDDEGENGEGGDQGLHGISPCIAKPG